MSDIREGGKCKLSVNATPRVRLVYSSGLSGRAAESLLSIFFMQEYIDGKQKDKESFKKLSKAKATAFNTLRAKVGKGSSRGGWSTHGVLSEIPPFCDGCLPHTGS